MTKRKILVNPVRYPLTFWLLSVGGVIVSDEPAEDLARPGAQVLPGFNNAGEWRSLIERNDLSTAQFCAVPEFNNAGEWRSLIETVGTARQGGTA